VIVVCGEALIDMIHNADGKERSAPGGGPFNTARALARLDVPTAFLGHLSTDAFGRELAGLLEKDGASLRFVTRGPEPTTIAVARVDHNGLAEYEFLVQGTSAPNLTSDMVPQEFDADVAALHLGTLGFVLEPMAGTLVKLVEREHGRRLVMVDPNVRPGIGTDDGYRDRLRRVMGQSTVVKASDADLTWLFPGFRYEQAAEQILADGARMAVVTLGAEGAFAAHRAIRVRVPAPQVKVVDTIGAGDAFGAALLAWLHDHDCIRPDPELNPAELKSALDFACLAASMTCTRAGADPPHRDELVPV
jgi:fructokinase